MEFNTSEQDKAYEKFLEERDFWVYEKELLINNIA